jgi:hypothetical protein
LYVSLAIIIHIYKIFTIVIDLGMQQGFETIKDDQLGAYAS